MNRTDLRQILLEKRSLITDSQYRSLNTRISHSITTKFECLQGLSIGLYWPYMGEFDSISLMKFFYECGSTVALPVVAEKKHPLKFLQWHPDAVMEKGVLNIPVPAGTLTVIPQVLFVPLLGHDDTGYRLGYGGGYYDRTLASIDPKPIAIGIGFETGRVESINPHKFDIPMDFIVTEKAVNYFKNQQSEVVHNQNKARELLTNLISHRFKYSEQREFSSPVCYAQFSANKDEL